MKIVFRNFVFSKEKLTLLREFGCTEEKVFIYLKVFISLQNILFIKIFKVKIDFRIAYFRDKDV